MTRLFRNLISTVLLLIMATAGQAQEKPVKILALGTSLTQGYGLPPGTEFTVQLQAALKRAGIAATVINAGVSGDTSAGGLARLDWSLADKPDAAIIELGSNDMLRGLPPAQTEKNLRATIACTTRNESRAMTANIGKGMQRLFLIARNYNRQLPHFRGRKFASIA